MADINFGIIDGGSNVLIWAPNANEKSVSRYQNTSGVSFSIGKVVAKFSDNDTAKVKAVVYSDNAGEPNTLLAVSDEVDGLTSSTRVDGVVTFTFAAPHVAAANEYVWIGFIANEAILNSYGDSTRSRRYNANTYTSGPTETFGTATSEAKGYRLLAITDDGQNRFGRASVDAATGTYQTNREHGDKFTIAYGADVTSISTYVRTTSATVKAKGAIYTDSAGVVGTKVAQTVETTGTTADTWHQLDFSTPVSLSAGTYWLCVVYDEDIGTNVISATGNIAVDGTVLESTAWPTTFSFVGYYPPSGMDIYASYDTPESSGTLAVTESSDQFASAGNVAIAGTVVATESGADSALFSWVSISQGTLETQETGGDSAAFTAGVSVVGLMSASETGADVAGFTGKVGAVISFSGNTPEIIGSFSLAESLTFNGITPAITGDFGLAMAFNGDAPAITGKFYIEAESSIAFSGKTPTIGGAFSLAMGFSGKTPSIEADFLLDTPGQLAFSGFTPAITGAFDLDEDNTITFSGYTPEIIGSFFLPAIAATDFSQTSDEVIRYRRGYDNG